MTDKSLQEQYGPEGICFGCGPKNVQGLRIQSYAIDDTHCVCEWQPSPHHEAFPGVLNGGIIGALLDCHSNWTAAWHLMRRAGTDVLPCTVTAEFAVKLLRPTPSSAPVRLTAEIVEASENRAVVDAKLESGGKICDTCRGTFVAVKPGHPAYHRW